MTRMSLIGIMRRVATIEEQTAQDLPPADVQQFVWDDSFAVATQVLLDKWKARGLDEDVLLAVQREVCSVQPEP
jgi:hypothetical protein